MFERADAPLLDGHAFAGSVDFFVFGTVSCHEAFVRFARSPEIEGEIDILTKRIAQKSSLMVVQVGAEELDPISGGAIDLLEPFCVARLDFILPED